jgi:hypothetical protein
MPRSPSHLIAMPLLAAILTACGGGNVTSGADPPVGSSGGSSSLSASSSSSGSSSSGSGSVSGGGSSSSSSASATTDVLTYHYDTMRTGQNLTETILTPSNVTSASFGLLHLLAADGPVDAAPLLVSKLTIGGALHNVVYIATENDSIYAYDADTAALLKQVSLLGSGETPSDSRSCSQVTPTIGITSTPVIDRSAGPNGTMYVVAMSRDSGGTYFQRLHALDLTTLADRLTPVVIQASYPGSAYGAGGQVTFVPEQYKERGALLLTQGQVFTVWASHCDAGAYNGWVIAYDEATLAQSAVLNLTPNGAQGGIWDIAGLALDSTGTLYTLVGNGSFDTTLTGSGLPGNQDYGNAAVKLSLSGATLAVTDYFTSWDTTAQSQGDVDLGSGSPLLIPDQVDSSGTTRHLMLAAGKDMALYLLDRDNMGKYNGNVASSDAIYQALPGALTHGVYSAPVYFHNSIYLAEVSGTLKQYAFSLARLPATPTSHSAATFGYPGTSPSISANGSSNAIVWAVESNAGSAAVLHAYNPANLAVEYYDSTQAAGSRDTFGNGNKFITPMVANGRVFVGTASGVAVFGLL